MLSYDSSVRPTVEELKKHPFLQQKINEKEIR
jgi:hypothetical protein